MRLLHTSDWHLGRTLLGKRRHREFEQMVDWMLQTIAQEAIDVVIIAGDIFDTTTPSLEAQNQYYRFLTEASRLPCQHVVVIGGNHDSGRFLNAPQGLLKQLGVHVVGHACEDPRDEVLLLRDAQGEIGLVVCAVPFLSDQAIRHYVPYESIADKDQRVVEGYYRHYAEVVAHGEALTAQYQVPLVATGHLFMRGGQVIEGDGVRELFVGTLGELGSDLFSPSINYVALGHLHQHQQVGQHTHIRYSGSPLPMCFDEARHAKQVLVVDFDDTHQAQIRPIEIPQFQALKSIRGDLGQLQQQLKELAALNQSIWLEVIYDAKDIQANLRQTLAVQVQNTELEILKLQRSHRPAAMQLEGDYPRQALHELSPLEVFKQCLARHEVPNEQHKELIDTFNTAWQRLHEEAHEELTEAQPTNNAEEQG